MNVSRPSSLRRVALASAALVVASTALTGCALDFIPDVSGEGKPDAAEQSPSPRAPEPAETDDTDTATTASGREHYLERVERTISCPDGTLDIADIAGIIALDSDCADITVSGSGTVLLANSIDRLSVVGVNNEVFVGSLGSLDVSGSGNTVTWEGGSPTVTNTGVNNEMNPAD